MYKCPSCNKSLSYAYSKCPICHEETGLDNNEESNMQIPKVYGTSKHHIAVGIFELLMDEAEANKGYEQFLTKFGQELSIDDISTIQEIRTDENNHQLRLIAMARKYDGGIPASKDNLQETLEVLTQDIK
jgi:hypothetical protein